MTRSSDQFIADDLVPTSQELLAGELTAALVQGQRDPDDALPPELAARIVATGEALVRARTVPPIAVPAGGAARAARRWVPWSGWLAAAALFVLFIRSPASGPVSPAAATSQSVDPVAALRDSLLADSALVRRSWTATTDSTATTASGEVLWDAATQRGVLRLVGLAPNASKAWQYQLWIFDGTRDERYPVDGGVFDIPAGASEVLVPIRARLAVGEAVLFAVTVEQPGGVVVSSRERIAVLAKI
jgi:hypothetical protein